MELASTSLPSTEDDLMLILAQIKQYNENVRDLLKGSDLKNNEDLEKCIFSLNSLTHDLSKTFCDKLCTATESLQSTVYLLKGLQKQCTDFGSNTEHINYLLSIIQILSNAAGHLRLAEKPLNETITQYIDNVDQTEGHREGVDEVDETLVVTNDIARTHTSHLSHEEEAQHGLNHVKTEDHKLESEERAKHASETNMVEEQDFGSEESGEESDKENRIPTIPEATKNNGPTLNPPKQQILESENGAYKEYMLQSDGENEQRLACFIKAPPVILQQLECRLMDDISSLVVSDSEELVSSVLLICSKDNHFKIPFPLSISIPYNARYRGNYKDVMVKTNDEKLESSYLTPSSLEGYHGNHKGSFAEVKVYKLGIFSVVSCLKKENFTVLKKGMSIKLSMDSRISLNYPPGCFNTSVILQFKVQPIDTSLISLLKVKHDIYHSVVSTSPLVHVKQPSVQLFLKPVTVFLPCPPNPEKKKQGDDTENKRASTATVPRVTAAHQIRAVSASVRKHGDNPTEVLKLLTFKEDQWMIMDDILVRNVQNGIVSFEIAEHIQSFIVIRLSSAMDNTHLISFIHSLQDATLSSMVNVVLYRRKDNLQKAIVEVVSSKELNWEILNLRDAGYTGPPEPSEQIPLQEGEQIHLRFCGNITATAGKASGKTFKLTFHSQRKQKLTLNLSVLDEFGNYSSPHYKGTVAIYKISKEDIVESYRSGTASDVILQQRNPVCKLSLTLPKVEKNVSRLSSTKLITNDPTDLLWDNLLHWLAQELSEEDASLLVLSLPIRRSTIQLVKLKSPDNLTDQVYELLTFWKKSLPTSADKLRLLARHLRKSGRSDLQEQLQLNWEAKKFVPAV
ncbi:death domain-containing protein 1 [Pelodytes ibericus]